MRQFKFSLATRPVLAALFSLAGAACGSSGASRSGAQCFSAQDCSPGNRCFDGNCVVGVSGDACSSGRECGSGFCSPQMICEVVCVEHADCGSAGVCELGVCTTSDEREGDDLQRCQLMRGRPRVSRRTEYDYDDFGRLVQEELMEDDAWARTVKYTWTGGVLSRSDIVRVGNQKNRVIEEVWTYDGDRLPRTNLVNEAELRINSSFTLDCLQALLSSAPDA